MTILRSNTEFKRCALTVLFTTSLILAGCGGQDEVAVNEPMEAPVVEQGTHDVDLTEEEVATLRRRQGVLSNSLEAVIEAGMRQGPLSENEGDASANQNAAVDPEEAWEALIGPIRENTIGYAWEGRHGELVYSGSEEAQIHIVQGEGGLELFKFDRQGFPYIHGVVRPGGELALNPATNRKRGQVAFMGPSGLHGWASV